MLVLQQHVSLSVKTITEPVAKKKSQRDYVLHLRSSSDSLFVSIFFRQKMQCMDCVNLAKVSWVASEALSFWVGRCFSRFEMSMR